MFDSIRNFLFGGNKHWVSAVKLTDLAIEQLTIELEKCQITSKSTTLKKISLVDELWEAFDAIPEPTADDLYLLQKNIEQIAEIKSDNLPVLTKFKFA